MKKVSFIFPPFLPSTTRHPYLSMELLTTILKENNYSCDKFDFNLIMNQQLYNLNIYKDVLDKVTVPTLKNLVLRAYNYRLNNEKPSSIPDWIWDQANSKISSLICEKRNTLEELFEKGLSFIPKVDELIDNFVDQVIHSSSNVIAFSVAFGEQLPYAIEMIERIKKKSPNTPVILGGAQISLLESTQIKLIQQHSNVDLIFQGYAEEKIVNVIEKLSVVREKALVLSGGALTRESLKGLPFSDFNYDGAYNKNHIYPILVTKGCYWGKCKFCDYVLMGDLGDDRYIARPVEEAYAEMKHVRQKDPEASFVLISDAVPPNWYKKLAKMANAENFKLNTYSYMINNRALNDEFFKEISQAGVRSFTFGTESTSDRVLNLMAKQANRETIVKNLELAEKYGVKVKVNLIPNYPTTTYQEAMDAYKIVQKFKNTIHTLSVFKFYLSANTSMFENPSEYGLEIDDAPYLKSESNGYHTVSYQQKGSGLTPEQEKKVYLFFYSLANEIAKNRNKMMVENNFERRRLDEISFKSSFEVTQEDGVDYLIDYVENVKLKVNQSLKEKISDIYGEGFVPKYKNLNEYLKDKKDSEEIVEFLMKNKLLVAS